MSLQGNSPFYPLVLMITERKRERECESARARECERGVCVCLCLSMWQIEAETLRAPHKKRIRSQSVGRRGPYSTIRITVDHIWVICLRRPLHGIYTTRPRSVHHAETERSGHGVFHWFFDWHSTAPAGPPALHGLPDVYAVPTAYDSTSPVSFFITVGYPSLGTVGIVRGASDQYFLRRFGAGDALHGGTHHHPAQFLGPSR